jgi:hypothetical protein
MKLSKHRTIEEYTNWLMTMQGDWDLFAVTAVFKVQANNNTQERFELEYKRVVRKLEKRLCRHACDKRYGTGDLLLDLPYKTPKLQTKCNERLKAKLAGITARERKVVTYHDLYYFEREEKSITSKHLHQFVPHIHGVIAIPKALLRKVWCTDNNALTCKMKCDFYSINTLESVCFERMAADGIAGWLKYITKQKPFYKH